MTTAYTAKRIPYLDTAKGILILLMLLGHIWNDGIVHDFIYAFHMPAFFVISGMLLNHSSSLKKSFFQNLLEKALRFLIPCLCFEIPGIAANILQHGVTLNIKGYMFEVFSLHLYNGPSWFLVVMFYCQMLCSAIMRLTNRKNVVLAVLFALVLILPKFISYISISTTVLGLFFLILGLSYEDFFIMESRFHILFWIALFITGLSSWNDVDMVNYQDGSRILFIVGALSGTYAILHLSRNAYINLLNYFGKNSLIILGSHHPILIATKHILGIEEFSILGGICFFVILLIIEIPLIEIVNRWLPFVAGKKIAFQNKPHFD